jgi:hypothetical protein
MRLVSTALRSLLCFAKMRECLDFMQATRVILVSQVLHPCTAAILHYYLYMCSSARCHLLAVFKMKFRNDGLLLKSDIQGRTVRKMKKS